MFTATLLLGSALCLQSCAGHDWDQSDEIFASPSLFVGRSVQVCGYFRFAPEDTNVWRRKSLWDDRVRSPANPDEVLGLQAEPFDWGRSLHNRSVCVMGEITRTGCGEESICTSSNSPFAVIVRAVEQR